FGYYFERSCGLLNDSSIIFYGRYIDDCLALVWAKSESDALKRLSVLRIDTCQIEWSASRFNQPFLDMLLFIDSTGHVQHMPYRKARNHQERIPWISHHPLDVLRGTVIGEMSRLAVLSSSFEIYKEALDGLYALYR